MVRDDDGITPGFARTRFQGLVSSITSASRQIGSLGIQFEPDHRARDLERTAHFQCMRGFVGGNLPEFNSRLLHVAGIAMLAAAFGHFD